MTRRYKDLDLTSEEVAFTAGGTRHAFPRTRLPKDFMDWMIAGRRAMYGHLEGHDTASFFGTHLPVVVTYSRDEPIPFNTGNKGVGLVPVAERLEKYCRLYEETLEKCSGMSWEESRTLRLEAPRRLIEDGDVSDERLASLEIFEKRTFRNLCDRPIAALHYTGAGPVYRSFQINVVVRIVRPTDPAYRFVFLSRRLFEHEPFHITQTRFPYAYLFYPVEVRDKTPRPRR